MATADGDVLAYDADGRLVDERLPDGAREYGYDDAGLTWDPAGRLASQTNGDQTATYAYDAAGRRVAEDGPDETVACRYDARGLLTDVERTTDDGATTAETRTLDGDGRLQSARLAGEDQAKATDHTWDLAQPVPEIVALDRRVDLPGKNKDRDDHVALLYGANGRVGYVRDDDTAGSLATDVMGSAIETASTTDLAAASVYTAYGEPVEANGHHREQTIAGQFGFRGELATSIGVHLRARDYDAHTGQFTTPDPLDGLPGRPVETSPYHYANNDPVNWTDPLGLSAITDCSLVPDVACMASLSYLAADGDGTAGRDHRLVRITAGNIAKFGAAITLGKQTVRDVVSFTRGPLRGVEIDRIRGVSRLGRTAGGGILGAAGQAVADVAAGDYETHEVVGRTTVSAGAGAGAAFLGGAAAGLACGPGAPVCSLVVGVSAAAVAGIGLRNIGSRITDAIGWGRLDE